jgi:hypothetical protein
MMMTFWTQPWRSWQTVLTAVAIAVIVFSVFALLRRIRSSRRRMAAWDAYAAQEMAQEPGPRARWLLLDSDGGHG